MFSVYSLCFTVLSYSLKARKHEEIQLKQPLGEIADESININLLQSNVLTTDEFYTVRCYFAYAIPPTFYDYANQTCCLKINTIKIKNLTANLRVF